MPVYQLGNEIHMHEGAGGVKRGQTELEKNLHHDIWRKRKGIKRGLRDIPQVQYEGYETSWDQEIQAKKCKGSINCQDVPVRQRCRAILSLQLTVSQQGTQGGATGHEVALCFVQV